MHASITIRFSQLMLLAHSRLRKKFSCASKTDLRFNPIPLMQVVNSSGGSFGSGGSARGGLPVIDPVWWLLVSLVRHRRRAVLRWLRAARLVARRSGLKWGLESRRHSSQQQQN